MLKLTYSHPDDEFQTVTVLGDPPGIFTLWFLLKDCPKAANIKITTLDGYPVPTNKGLAELYTHATQLSKRCSTL